MKQIQRLSNSIFHNRILFRFYLEINAVAIYTMYTNLQINFIIADNRF